MSAHADGGPRRVLWLALFAVAMGLLEAAIVVYLRELYYPDGFRFPIVIIPGRVAIIELTRELTTILMLLAVAVLAGCDRLDRFFVFSFLFGGWDLVYYLGLWVFLGWPASPWTWDVLFLIPVPWLGPVVYPVVISCCLVTGFLVHDGLRRRRRVLRPTAAEWVVASTGALLVIVAFCWNWRSVAEQTTPTSFPVGWFSLGLLGALLPFVRASLRAVR